MNPEKVSALLLIGQQDTILFTDVWFISFTLFLCVFVFRLLLRLGLDFIHSPLL